MRSGRRCTIGRPTSAWTRSSGATSAWKRSSGETNNGRTSNGGTSNGGTNNGGTNNGGTSNGGTSKGGTNNGGTSNGGTNNDGTNNGGTSNGGTSTTWTGDLVQEFGLILDNPTDRAVSTGHIVNRTENGNYSSWSMPPKRTVCYQQREWQHTRHHAHSVAMESSNVSASHQRWRNHIVKVKVLVVRWSIGNAKRLDQRCVG